MTKPIVSHCTECQTALNEDEVYGEWDDLCKECFDDLEEDEQDD